MPMANSTRDSTAALRQPVSSASSLYSPFGKQLTSSPLPPLSSPAYPLTQLANAGLSAAKQSIPNKYTMPPQYHPPPLTGAAAMADNRRWEEEQEAERKRAVNMTSANPANTLRMGLQGPLISRPSDAPRTSSETSQDVSYVAEPADMGVSRVDTPTTQSPLPMDLPDRQAQISSNVNPKKRPASPRVEERSAKAMTYPPQLAAEMESPRSQRNMSFPSPSASMNLSKSPSAVKKHKCPHCATEFTRHHNLKSHLLTHSQEKPYGCEQCTSRFRRLHDLKRHIKLHTGERSHACNQCGRKFARGDALARHNKGPGGCAGRRGSAGDGGVDDFTQDHDVDPSMEDSTYHGGDGQDFGNEENHFNTDARRRRSEGHHRHDTLGSVGSSISGSYHQHSSTYPGIAPMSRGGFYQHSASQSSLDLSREPQNDASKELPALAPTQTASQFAQGIITESPAPLSPGIQETKQSNANASLNLHLQERRLAPIPGSNLPPAAISQPPTSSLPSMNMFAHESRFAPPPTAPTSVAQKSPAHTSKHNSTSSGGPSAGSLSSHGHSSIGSMRDILNSEPPNYSQELPPMQSQPQAPQDLLKQENMLEYMKNMERRVEEQVARRLEEQMAERMREQEAQYKAQISRLNEQISTLTGQQQQQQQHQNQEQQHRAPH